MSTNNFHNKNASRIFAFEVADEWDWNDMKLNIRSELKAKGWVNDDSTPNSELRSYPASVISRKTEEHFTGLALTVKAIVRSGYYMGGNLDWELEWSMQGSDWDEPNEKDIEDGIAYWRGHRRLAKAHASKAMTWSEDIKDKLITELETIYEQFTTPLRKVAQFSNGEAIYEKA